MVYDMKWVMVGLQQSPTLYIRRATFQVDASGAFCGLQIGAWEAVEVKSFYSERDKDDWILGETP